MFGHLSITCLLWTEPMSPFNFVQSPFVAISGDRALRKAMKVKCGHNGRAVIQGDLCLSWKIGPKKCTWPGEQLCEDRMRKLLSTRQEVCPPHGPTLLPPSSPTPSFQNSESIKCYWWNHPVCSYSIGRPGKPTQCLVTPKCWNCLSVCIQLQKMLERTHCWI